MKFSQSEQQREKQTEKTQKPKKKKKNPEPQGSVEEYQKMQQEGRLGGVVS